MSRDLKTIMAEAEKGDELALIELATAYFNGEVNGRTEIGNGLECMEKAAKKGNPKIQHQCGVLYKELGLHETAFKWYMEAALNNHADSQAMVASYYYTDLAGEKDEKKAFKWAKLAYENGEECEAPTLLGVMYCLGRATKQDIIEGYKMLRIAASKGNETAAEYKAALEKDYPMLKKL